MKEIFSAGLMINSIYVLPGIVIMYEKSNYLIVSLRFLKYFIDITFYDNETTDTEHQA